MGSFSPRGAERHSIVSQTLAQDRLGTVGVAQFVLTSAAPLLVVAGIVTTGWALTGIVAVPVAFIGLAVLLGIFAIGYMAMARKVGPNAGALYTFAAHGLGKPAGVAAGLLATLSYNVMQIGAYGMFGAVASGMLHNYFAVQIAWWVCALTAWLLVAIMGGRRVDLNGRVLAVLLTGEIAFVVVASITGLLHPAEGQVSLAALNPAGLAAAGAAAAFAIAWTGYVGFEQAPVYSEESRSPHLTVPAATFGSLALMAGVYTLASWAMSVAVGPQHIVEQSRQQSVELLFTVAAPLGTAAGVAGHLLFLSSLFAGMLAFHSTTSRYAYALGRERVLPRVLGRTSPRTGAPVAASLTQTGFGFAAIVVYAVMGWNPITQMMFFLATAGGVGVLLVLTVASVAVAIYFLRRAGRGVRGTIAAAVVAAVGLIGVSYLCLSHFATLLGVAEDHALTWIIPACYFSILAAGLGWGLIMRAFDHPAYERIGRGAAVAPASVATGAA